MSTLPSEDDEGEIRAQDLTFLGSKSRRKSSRTATASASQVKDSPNVASQTRSRRSGPQAIESRPNGNQNIASSLLGRLNNNKLNVASSPLSRSRPSGNQANVSRPNNNQANVVSQTSWPAVSSSWLWSVLQNIKRPFTWLTWLSWVPDFFTGFITRFMLRFLLFCLFVAYVGLYAFLYSVRFWGLEVLIGYSQHPYICTFYTFQPWWAPLCTLKPNTPGHEGITISSKDGKIWPSLEDVFMESFPNSNNTVSPSTAQKVFMENQVQWLSNQTFFYDTLRRDISKQMAWEGQSQPVCINNNQTKHPLAEIHASIDALHNTISAFHSDLDQHAVIALRFDNILEATVAIYLRQSSYPPVVARWWQIPLKEDQKNQRESLAEAIRDTNRVLNDLRTQFDSPAQRNKAFIIIESSLSNLVHEFQFQVEKEQQCFDNNLSPLLNPHPDPWTNFLTLLATWTGTNPPRHPREVQLRICAAQQEQKLLLSRQELISRLGELDAQALAGTKFLWDFLQSRLNGYAELDAMTNEDAQARIIEGKQLAEAHASAVVGLATQLSAREASKAQVEVRRRKELEKVREQKKKEKRSKVEREKIKGT